MHALQQVKITYFITLFFTSHSTYRYGDTFIIERPKKCLYYASYFADLGVGQKDWLQFLQEQVKEDCEKNNSTNTSAETCERIISNACVTMELQEEKNKEDLDKLNQKQQQQDGNCVDVTTSHLITKFQCSQHQKEEQAEEWSQSSSQSQGIEGTQVPSRQAPATPLSSLLNTSLNSPMLLLPQGG